MLFGSRVRSEVLRPVAWIVLASLTLWAAPCFAEPANPAPGAVVSIVTPDRSSTLEGLLDHVDVSLGASDLSGDFGAQKTTDIAIALASASYRVDGLRLTASLPWMRISSPGAVFTGIEGTPIIADPEATGGRRLRQGLGDLTLGASYILPPRLTAGVDTDLLFRVKAPTASASSRLSTGQADYSVGGTLTKAIGPFSPLVTAFYRSFGQAPMFHLKDGVLTSVGTTYNFSPTVTGLLTYDYSQRASRFISDAHQISADLTALVPHTKVRITSFVSGGLSRGAPAVSAGLSLALRL